MTIEEILNGESKRIEYKVELPEKSDRYMKSIIAFANTAGGSLVIGVDDTNRNIVGVNEKEVFCIMDQITNAISDSCEPQIVPNIYMQAIDDKCLIVVEIYPGSSRPYYLKSAGKVNGTYIRVGATSRQAHPLKIKELEMEGMNIYWDELTCVGYEVTDEAVKKLCGDIKSYMLESMHSQEDKENVKDVTIDQLINWNVLKFVEGKLMATNAFALLTSDYFYFSKIQCALFKGIERDVFIDKKEYIGPLYEQIENAYQFVLRHINISAEINGLIRKEHYELPIGAIREMIINGICHRNFNDSSCVQVAIYDDRIEVTSPGSLYKGLTLEEALGGRSKIRNRAIAHVFSQMDLIEEWGTGMKRIIKRAKEYDLPEPKFEEYGETFRTTLYKKDKDNNDKKELLSVYTDEKNDKIISREKTILDFINHHESINNREARMLLGLSESATKRFLKQMVDKGLINMKGSTKNRRYYKVIKAEIKAEKPK